jgi:ribose transport system ATP-binding protein
VQKKQEQDALTIERICKSFGDTQVLFDITLDFHIGEVHALVGENGAGKSTVGKIIGGYYSRDKGDISVFNQKIDSWSPKQALSYGIAMIHQELSLVPELTVGENIYLGIESNRSGILRRDEKERFDELDALCGFGLNPNAKVSSLRIADQQKIEIMRALSRDARVIIMDEPTSSLTADETDRLHEVIAWLKKSGRTVIYVTHFLEHVLAHSDRVSVMRDGHLIKTALTKNEDKTSLVEGMLGYAAEIAFPQRPSLPEKKAEPVLEVSNISTYSGIQNVSLDIRSGEIIGLLGLVGSGRTETARAIFGADPLKSGEIKVNGKIYQHPSPQESIKRGVVMIPEDRRQQGLIATQTVKANVTLPHLDKLNRFGVIDLNKEHNKVKKLIKRLGIVPTKVDGEVVNYSGGNQQKVLFAKWMFGNPDLIILDEPTRGVDIGAKRKIYELINQLAVEGAAVLIISSELEEVLGLSHRGYLMKNGATITEIDTTLATVEEILHQLFEPVNTFQTEQTA